VIASHLLVYSNRYGMWYGALTASGHRRYTAVYELATHFTEDEARELVEAANRIGPLTISRQDAHGESLSVAPVVAIAVVEPDAPPTTGGAT
jgi:hypothetical protein